MFNHLEVESFESVLAKASELDLALKHVSDTIQVTRTAQAELAPVGSVRPFEYTGVQFIELSLRNSRTGQLDDALVRVSHPVGFRRNVGLTVLDCTTSSNAALFPLLQEPHQPTGEPARDSVSCGRIHRSGLSSFTKERSKFQLRHVINTIVETSFLVRASFVIDSWGFQRRAGELKRSLEDLRIVNRFVREFNPAGARTRTFRERRTHRVDMLANSSRSHVEKVSLCGDEFQFHITTADHSHTTSDIGIRRCRRTSSADTHVEQFYNRINLEVRSVSDIQPNSTHSSNIKVTITVATCCGYTGRSKRTSLVPRSCGSSYRSSLDRSPAFFLPAELRDRRFIVVHH